MAKKYTKIFDEKSPNWDAEAVFSKMFLQTQEIYANDIFRAQGYLFLRDVYDMLGFGPITKDSIVVGWYKSSEDKDKHISFDVEQIGDESKFKLTFNVDGNILDFFEEEQGE